IDHDVPATKIWSIPDSIGVPEFPQGENRRHQLCPGCGESVALQALAEVIDEEGLREKTVCAIGIGCYSLVGNLLDVDIVQSLHGRATAVATGIKRTHPDLFVLTLQGRSEEHTSELQSCENLVCRLLLEKKKQNTQAY